MMSNDENAIVRGELIKLLIQHWPEHNTKPDRLVRDAEILFQYIKNGAPKEGLGLRAA